MKKNSKMDESPIKVALRYIKGLKKENISFSMGTTNRSIYVRTGTITRKFVDGKALSKRTFMAFNMVKTDISKSGKRVDRLDVKYFQHDLREDIHSKTAWYIDLKSAYATILRNENFITEKTFSYLSTLPKMDRLVCIGLLASRRTWSDWKGGKFVNEVVEESPLSDYFYYACRRTFEIMSVVKSLIGKENALLNWVDCIYFKEANEGSRQAIAYLCEQGFDVHFNTIENFHAVIFKKYVRVSFWDNGKKKCWFIPHATGQVKKIKTDIIL